MTWLYNKNIAMQRKQMMKGMRKYDKDGSLADELEATVKGGNPHLEGIVYPRIAEVSLFGGLGCGRVRTTSFWFIAIRLFQTVQVKMVTNDF